jgi:hypothetical protein
MPEPASVRMSQLKLTAGGDGSLQAMQARRDILRQRLARVLHWEILSRLLADEGRYAWHRLIGSRFIGRLFLIVLHLEAGSLELLDDLIARVV